MQKLLIILIVIGFYSCVPKEENTYTNIDITLNSESVQEVINFQNQHSLDSLYPYMNHVDPGLRYLATNALASQNDGHSNDYLFQVLGDSILKNKAIAAYALGQSEIGEVTKELIGSFVQQDTSISVDNIANRNILEAIGKKGDKSLLNLIASVDYIPSDNELLLGQTRAIYRFSQRGITDSLATKRMVDYTIESHYNDKVRTLASAYLARSKKVDVSKYKARLLQRYIKEKNVFVKMNLVTALGRTKDAEVMKKFFEELKKNIDYRVKVNIVNSLGDFPYINIIEPILLRLTDDNVFVAEAAADMLKKYGNKYDASIYQNYISDRNSFSLNAKIYSAVLSNLWPRSYRFVNLSSQLVNSINESKSDAERIAYIEGLGNVPAQYKFIIDSLATASYPVKTAMLSALSSMYKLSDKTFGFRAKAVKEEIFQSVKNEMLSLDVGAVSIGSTMITDEENKLSEYIGDDIDWLVGIKNELIMPAGVEAKAEVLKAIAFLKNEKFTPIKFDFQHKIDWSILEGVSDSTRCIIKTNKGSITIKLFPMESPATVANFIDLVRKGYYNNKSFHRVVPNFVIQTGCDRGDGYGSEEYVINSELGPQYYDDEGFMGMASSGKNTESTQWFITHRPTPHLDGKYTIFAKVTKGMDVVHRITQGDTMESLVMSSL